MKRSDTKAGSKIAEFCCLFTLDDSAWTRKAKEILEWTDAQDVSSTGEAAAATDAKDRAGEVVQRKTSLAGEANLEQQT
jgi:hypothetical protein